MELFLVDDCDDIPLGAVLGVVKVECRLPPGDWAERGGEEQEGDIEQEDGSHFFYQKWLVFTCTVIFVHFPVPFQV